MIVFGYIIVIESVKVIYLILLEGMYFSVDIKGIVIVFIFYI